MKACKDMIEFLEEQLWYTQTMMRESKTYDRRQYWEAKFWAYWDTKRFLQDELGHKNDERKLQLDRQTDIRRQKW